MEETQTKKPIPVKIILTIVLAFILLLALTIVLLTRSEGSITSLLSNQPNEQIEPDSPSTLPEGVANGRHCADFETDGETVNICTTCGDKICEEKEACAVLITGRSYTKEDCGPLFCPGDCKNIVPSGS